VAHVWDATPETIAALRRCCEPLGRARISDYDDPASPLMLRLRRDIHTLRRQIGAGLFVQEPAALGGFGYVKGEERFNEDTVRFFEVIAALQDAALLGEFRHARERRVVWEIGGGWGGFAYQFKTVCPNVTYLITGAPDLLLVSAVYLTTVLPGARFRFYDASSPDEFWHDWDTVDVLFAPEAAVAALRPPRVDLTIDLMALPIMGASRAWSHVQHAFDFGCRYFYSLREPGCCADGAATLRRAIERLYWLHPVPSRTDADPAANSGTRAPALATESVHMVGWRRMRV
jgi:hypothetical protein